MKDKQDQPQLDRRSFLNSIGVCVCGTSLYGLPPFS
ncbi:MAG: hypothetical protein H6Q04_2295, partial [Acidobacteria bacterium]|nr:hypothetical protein [Acidobacteriota bacterium]